MSTSKLTPREVAFILFLGTVVALILALVGAPIWLFGIVGGLTAATYANVREGLHRRRAR
ncbi:MAG: hypothetical protein E6G53_03780 [Actinobacteria bacterium]|nr:MAG: hypothetical protein E6G53_03780 [Actinomycetota bacterium]